VQTILVVDDEFGVAEVLAVELEDEGYRVVMAANGKHGLERLAESKPVLVVLDFMMPIMDGAKMAHAMRAVPEYRDIPIIMTSAAPEAAVRARFDGYAAFLRKPFKASELMRHVNALLKSRA
jgi:CheY-like chemotaxis protein